MKIYRISNTRRPGREHDGFEYLSNKAEALKKQNQNERQYYEAQNDDNYDDIDDKDLSYNKDEVEQFEIAITKAGILNFLNEHCEYPNNG